MSKANIILTTNITSSSEYLSNIERFPVVIVDEAQLADEATCLLPLSLSGIEKCLIVGDNKQLGPVSDVSYFDRSPFLRILKNNQHITKSLETQYRMSYQLSDFPMKHFYKDTNITNKRPTDEELDLSGAQPVCFFDYKHRYIGELSKSYEEKDGFTYIIQGELNYIKKLIKRLLSEEGITRVKFL